MMGGENTVGKSRTESEKFDFGPWKLTATKSHILKSEGPERERFEGDLELPQLPEMVFANNVLRIENVDGFGIEFNAFDALKCVDAHHDPLKVAVSQAWKNARSDCEHIKEVVKPFDWTFTTDYKGTLISGSEDRKISVCPTDEKIDLEKLKVREKIHFYADILLFEDELADNGTSLLNVKVRVMPTSFFVLLRFFMRVDNVMVRINDTRLYHEAGKDYIIREFTSKDKKTSEIKAPSHVLIDPNIVQDYLTVRRHVVEKLQFPPSNAARPSGTVAENSSENTKCPVDASDKT